MDLLRNAEYRIYVIPLVDFLYSLKNLPPKRLQDRFFTVLF